MIEIAEGFFVNEARVTVVKTAGAQKCLLYVTGQTALDGFLLERDAREVAEEILAAQWEQDNEEETDEE